MSGNIEKNIFLSAVALVFSCNFLHSQNNINPKIADAKSEQNKNISDSVFVMINERNGITLSNSEYAEYLKHNNIELIWSARKSSGKKEEEQDKGKRISPGDK